MTEKRTIKKLWVEVINFVKKLWVEVINFVTKQKVNPPPKKYCNYFTDRILYTVKYINKDILIPCDICKFNFSYIRVFAVVTTRIPLSKNEVYKAQNYRTLNLCSECESLFPRRPITYEQQL